jgi:hypothetical protein
MIPLLSGPAPRSTMGGNDVVADPRVTLLSVSLIRICAVSGTVPETIMTAFAGLLSALPGHGVPVSAYAVQGNVPDDQPPFGGK